MCGDSTDEAMMKRLMDGDMADMVFTDPPYGVSIGDKNAALNSVQKAGRCSGMRFCYRLPRCKVDQ